MDRLVAMLRAAGDPTRLRLLLLLRQAELTVSELIEIVGQSQPRVSRHLKLLGEADCWSGSRKAAGFSTAPPIVAKARNWGRRWPVWPIRIWVMPIPRGSPMGVRRGLLPLPLISKPMRRK